MAIGENRNKDEAIYSKLCLLRQLSLHDNQTMQSMHYSTCFADSNAYFFILRPVTRECDPKVLELLYLLQFHSAHLQRTLDRFSRKMKYLSLGSANIHASIIACSCKTVIVRVGGQIRSKAF